MAELTEIEKSIIKKIEEEYRNKGIVFTEEQYYFIKNMVQLANTQGDGYKRIQRMGEETVFLVPIEDIILHGVKAEELDKYRKEKI